METYWTTVPPMPLGSETNPNKTIFTITIQGILPKRSSPPVSTSNEYDINSTTSNDSASDDTASNDAASYISHHGLRRHLTNLRIIPTHIYLFLSHNHQKLIRWYKQHQIDKKRKSYIPPPSFLQRLGWVRNDSVCLCWRGKERMRELLGAWLERVRNLRDRGKRGIRIRGDKLKERAIAGVIELLLAVNRLVRVGKKLRRVAKRIKFRIIGLIITLLLVINTGIQITKPALLATGIWIKFSIIRSIISTLLLINHTMELITQKSISINNTCTTLNEKIYTIGRPYILAGITYLLTTIQAVLKLLQQLVRLDKLKKQQIPSSLQNMESPTPMGSCTSIGITSPYSSISTFFTSTTNLIISSASSIKEVIMKPRMLLPIHKDTESRGGKHTNSMYDMWMVFITSRRMERVVAVGEGERDRRGLSMVV